MLHTHLHQEVEKIRKWKTHTEMEHKQKERKILDANQTIDSLRKSMLELQLQNENLSLKLQEEIGNREEIVTRIDATREMCNVLKDYTANVEDRLQKCETEKTEVKYLEKEHLKYFEELSRKFNKLTLTTSEVKAKLEQQLESEINERISMEEQNKETLKAAEEKLKSLTAECEEKTSCINSMAEELAINQLALQNIEAQHATIECRLQEMQEVASGHKSQLDNRNEELHTLKDCHFKLEGRLEEATTRLQEAMTSKEKLAKNFDETEKLYVDKIKSLQEELNTTQERMEKQTHRTEELQADLMKTRNCVEDLKCTKDMLILERTEAQNKISEMENSQTCLSKQCRELEQEIEIARANHAALELDKNKLLTQCQALQDTARSNEEEMKCLSLHVASVEADIKRLNLKLETAESEVENLQRQLTDALGRETESLNKIDVLKVQLQNESGEHEELTDKMDQLHTKTTSLEKELNTKKKDITKLEKELEKCKGRENQTRGKLEATQKQFIEQQQKLEDLQNVADAAEESEARLKEEEIYVADLKHDLEKSNNAIADLQAKIQSMKSESTSKNKHNRDLEKEVKGLKSKLASNTKASTKLEDVSKGLQDELQTATETLKETEALVARLRDELKEQIEKAEKCEKECKEHKMSAEKVTKEKEASSRECEGRIQDCARALDNYKQGYDEVIASKDKEITDFKKQLEETRSQVEEMKSSAAKMDLEKDSTAKQIENQFAEVKKELENQKKEHHTAINKKNREIEQLKKKLANAETKGDQKKKIKEQEGQIKTLKEDIKEKESKLTAMQSEIEKMRLHRPPIAACTPQIKNTPIITANTPKTPQNINSLKTPVALQQSILKPPHTNGSLSETLAKRRKVVFKSDDTESVCSQASSSSELMEIELDEIENRMSKGKTAATPLMLKPSPHVRASPGIAATPSRGARTPALPFKPVARGQTAQNNKNRIGATETEELAQFKQLFPDTENDSSFLGSAKSKRQIPAKTTPNIRKAPNKTPGRFFKSSPMERHKQKMKARGKAGEEFSWFDSDSTFGFSADD